MPFVSTSLTQLNLINVKQTIETAWISVYSLSCHLSKHIQSGWTIYFLWLFRPNSKKKPKTWSNCLITIKRGSYFDISEPVIILDRDVADMNNSPFPSQPIHKGYLAQWSSFRTALACFPSGTIPKNQSMFRSGPNYLLSKAWHPFHVSLLRSFAPQFSRL